jgi:hypothetical protein
MGARQELEKLEFLIWWLKNKTGFLTKMGAWLSGKTSRRKSRNHEQVELRNQNPPQAITGTRTLVTNIKLDSTGRRSRGRN